MPDKVLLAVAAGVATITLNRPEAGNSVDLELAHAFAGAARACADDAAVRCVVVTGAGRLFCAGGDIVAMQEAGDRAGAVLAELAGTFHQATKALAAMAKPLVCAVNGPAAGAGLGLAVMGDVVLAAKSAHFTAAYGAIGLTPDGGATFLLPRLIGLRRAQEMLLLNKRVGAEEGAAIGLVTRAVDDEMLAAEVAATAAKLASAAIGAVGVVRALLLASFGTALDAQLDREVACISAAAAGAEGREGIAAFLGKRKPDFTRAAAG